MNGGVVRSRALLACVALGLAACASHAPSGGANVGTPGPSASASGLGPGVASTPAANASATPARSPGASATPSEVPIQVQSHKVGSKYIYLTKQKADRKVYVLRADSESGQYFGGDTGRSDFVNPHITFFAVDGRRLIADAPAGEIVAKEKVVRMTGGVRARTADGKTLACDTLRYDDDGEIMHGDGNVVVTTPDGERLQGDALLWNMRTGRLDVTGAR